MRRLRSTRRHVALDHSDEYLGAWTRVQRAVTAASGRAWLFRGAGREDHFLEFIEWADPAAPLVDNAVNGALADLDEFARPTHIEEWEEAG
jgi:hypothetical protein